MPDHGRPLLGGQLAGFLENCVRHAELADIVKKGGPVHNRKLLPRKPQTTGDLVCRSRNAGGVVVGERRLRVDDAGESGTDIVESLACRGHRMIRGFQSVNPGGSSVAFQVFPELSRARERFGGKHQAWIEPSAAPLLRDLDRARGSLFIGSAFGIKDIKRLRRFKILENNGMSRWLRPSGYPPPSQCSSRDWIARAVASVSPIWRAMRLRARSGSAPVRGIAAFASRQPSGDPRRARKKAGRCECGARRTAAIPSRAWSNPCF